jgi:type IV secretory pathway VirB2 component (pilin)
MRSRSWCLCSLVLLLCTFPQAAFAQSPWEQAAQRLSQSFTGPLATALSLVAITVGGFIMMFGDGAAKRTLAGLIAGIAMAVGATRFFNWLFT